MTIIRIPVEERFAKYFTRGKKNECWEWQGHRDKDGYGDLVVHDTTKKWGHTPKRAHRISYEIYKGPIPKGKWVLHECDNPPCVNPHHLKIGHGKENNADQIKRGRIARGETNGWSKLTEKDVRAIRADRRYQYVIAKDYDIRQCTVSAIKRRVTWRHVK